MKVRGVFPVGIMLMLLLGVSSSFAQQYEDVVYLKDGGVRRGLILEQIPNESVKLKTNYGEIFVIQMSDISRIAKEEKEVPVAESVAKIDNAPRGMSIASAQVDRKGFVLNLGMGVGRVSTSIDNVSVDENAITTDFKIGYAPNNQWAIYYTNDASFYKPPWTDDRLYSGMSGIGGTYFLKPGEKSFFVNAAVGISILSSVSEVSDSETGTGFALGGGYEFSSNWLVDVDLVIGSFDLDISVNTMRVGVNWFYY
jgi:opacity protein-like surface antigen